MFFVRPVRVADATLLIIWAAHRESTNHPDILKAILVKPAGVFRPASFGIVRCFNPTNRHARKESERFRPFSYEEIIKRDKLSLDIFWLKDDSLEDSSSLPEPDVIAAEIIEDLEAALGEFAQIAADLKPR